MQFPILLLSLPMYGYSYTFRPSPADGTGCLQYVLWLASNLFPYRPMTSLQGSQSPPPLRAFQPGFRLAGPSREATYSFALTLP